MPYYVAIIIKDDTLAMEPPMFINQMDIRFFAKTIHHAEFMMIEYCKYVYPYLKVDTIYELAYTPDGDPTVTEGDNKRS